MKRLLPALMLTSLLAANATHAAAPVADDAVFVEGTRYSAVFSPDQRSWRLLPADGDDIHLTLSPDCGRGTSLPRGLWLLTRDGEGRPQLVAPSSTALPAGHAGQVRLVGCDQAASAGETALAVPAHLVQWLEHRSGSIYVVR